MLPCYPYNKLVKKAKVYILWVGWSSTRKSSLPKTHLSSVYVYVVGIHKLSKWLTCSPLLLFYPHNSPVWYTRLREQLAQGYPASFKALGDWNPGVSVLAQPAAGASKSLLRCQFPISPANLFLCCTKDGENRWTRECSATGEHMADTHWQLLREHSCHFLLAEHVLGSSFSLPFEDGSSSSSNCKNQACMSLADPQDLEDTSACFCLLVLLLGRWVPVSF